jgi:hypothetical protein
MSDQTGVYTMPELRARYERASETLLRTIIDRLGLGMRIHGCRVVFAEELPIIEIALKARGKLTTLVDGEIS